ncbi:MAG: hypothetical protein AB1798_22920 [Spirochaetota bacterium]
MIYIVYTRLHSTAKRKNPEDWFSYIYTYERWHQVYSIICAGVRIRTEFSVSGVVWPGDHQPVIPVWHRNIGSWLPWSSCLSHILHFIKNMGITDVSYDFFTCREFGNDIDDI